MSHTHTMEVTDELEELVGSTDVLDTDDEETDPSFEMESLTLTTWSKHSVKTGFHTSVGRTQVSLSLFLCFQLTKHLTLGETKAAVLAGMMVGKSDKPFESGGKSSMRMMALSLQRSRADMNGCLVK